MRARILPGYSRVFFLLLNLLLGLLPSALFFVWVERNTSLPLIPLSLHWPWIELSGRPLLASIAWDTCLVLAFGFIHSLMAQTGAYRLIGRIFPLQSLRTLYLVITGLSLILVMGLWQNTGQVLWVLPLSPLLLNALSLLIYWGLVLYGFNLLRRFDPLYFVGLRQLYQTAEQIQSAAHESGSIELIKTGAYAWVRHPLYLFTLSGFLVTPFMTLDRMTVFLAVVLYLKAGVSVEERKLVATFGAAYQDYQKQVPAIFPFKWTLGMFPK